MFNKDFLTLKQLTATWNKTPFVETTLSRFFTVGRLRTRSAMVERGATGLKLIDPGALYQPAPAASDHKLVRGQYTISAVKLGRVVSFSGEDIQDVRAFGTEDELETFEQVFNRDTATIRRWLEHTHEFQRGNVLKGRQVDSEGNLLFDFFGAAGVTAPQSVAIDYDTASRRQLQNLVADVVDYSRDGLGAGADDAQRFVMLHGKNDWRRFRTCDAVAALYDRYQDGAVNRAGATGQRAPFELFDVAHLPYYGPSLGADEWQLVPVVPGLLRTDFTPLDNPETANTLGLPGYATPHATPFNKGVQVEIASLPIHYITNPAAVIGGTSTGSIDGSVEAEEGAGA
ncbi:major capsid protein [Paracoccus sp. SSK6]|uniref:major capsid protein n=1 Tax=Paracoccus sp. SSK6 TaxID=3143131 RepID=UPI00321A6CB3